MEVTEGHLLGGRVGYAQPKEGYRSGIEPVLLAAAVPARAGETVLEAGTGAGAGLLCLMARVPGLSVTGIEIDPAMAGLARHNLAANGAEGLIVTGDILLGDLPSVDHALANPPWHDRRSSASPVPRRQLAKQAVGRGVEGWIAALSAAVKSGGTLTLILPANQASAGVAALVAAGLNAVVSQPLLPKAGRPAKLALLQARRGRLAAERRTGIVLHEADGRYTAEIESVLREGRALSLGLTAG